MIRMIVEKYDLRNRITRDQRQLKISQWLGLGSECWAWLEMLVFDKIKLNKPELRLSQRHRKSQGSKPVKTRTNMYGLGAIKCCLIQGSGSSSGLEPSGTAWDWVRGEQGQ